MLPGTMATRRARGVNSPLQRGPPCGLEEGGTEGEGGGLPLPRGTGLELLTSLEEEALCSHKRYMLHRAEPTQTQFRKRETEYSMHVQHCEAKV